MPRKNQYQWNMAEQNQQDEEQPSRSQKKRDSSALQRLGEEVAALPDASLASFPLKPNLRDAISQWRAFASHESKRRQMQFIGRLMREEADIPALRAALDALKAGRTENSIAFKKAETVRDALLAAADENDMAKLLRSLSLTPDTAPSSDQGDFPYSGPGSEPGSSSGSGANTQEALAEIIKLALEARNERANGRPPRAYRALFRRLREVLADGKS